MSVVRNKLATGAGVAVVILAAAAGARSQATCRIVLPERLHTEPIIQKAERVSAIIDQLAIHRKTFLSAGANVELFPMLYYHSTLSELENAAALPPAEAEALLDMVIVFYDAYQYNRVLYDRRGPAAVEKHWRRYYRIASRKGGLTPREFTSLLLDGIDAHLADLSRTLRYTFERTKLSRENLRQMYYGLDTSFGKVAKAAEMDIRTIRVDPLMGFQNSFGLGAKYVIHARHRAWEAAVADGRLRANGPQPVMPHYARSRTVFTLTPGSGCGEKPA